MRNLRIAGMSLLLFFAAASTAFAQSRTLGARIGTSVATLDIEADEALDEENRTGLVAGVFYNQQFGPLGYQLEVLYAKRGADFGDGSTLDLTYVTIPALLKVGLPAGLLRPSAFAGVALALEVDCEVENGASASCDDIGGVEVESTDWNGVLGAELALGLVGVTVLADGRYYVGLSDVGDFDDAVDEALGDVKNRSWEFTVGAGIPLP